MKKKILIPTDFSKNAWNALTYAADLFKDQECTFYLLNTFGSLGYSIADLMVSEPGTRSYDSALEASESGMEKLVSMIDFRETNPKHKYEVVSEYGDLLGAMKAFVEKKDIELIVMGTKGAANKRGALFGSNTILAMEKLRNCPTLGIPLDTRVASLKEIVFPTSYKTHYKRKELSHLIEFARQQDATVAVIHASTSDDLTEEQEEHKKLLIECLEGTKITFHHLHSTSPIEAVQNFVESRDSDMIAFINKKHAFFGSVFTNPMVKELGMFSKVPLLVMHDLRN